jgi:beta-fructofuranosidase
VSPASYSYLTEVQSKLVAQLIFFAFRGERNPISSRGSRPADLVKMAYNRFRPTCHFIGPHSWLNDPCGAVYIPETKEYIFCYQWNPGTTEGGNSAWGMARSTDMVTWEDCPPALRNGITTTYDSLGVFSGCTVSRLINGKRKLFLFYTSVSGLPIHWSKHYIEGCETQSVAFSTDFGRSWHRYENNPLIRVPPKKDATTAWRDPFVSTWKSLSSLLGIDPSTDYLMNSSSERGRSQLHLYQSNNLLDWKPVCTILDVAECSKVSPSSCFRFGMNFECASFFTIDQTDYIVVGVEEDATSKRHREHYCLWLCGTLSLESGSPEFKISSHGVLDHGILYAAHTFRDAEDRIISLGWADEAAQKDIVRLQGWAGCFTQPRELYQISRPVTEELLGDNLWNIDQQNGKATTLGIRPAPQLQGLRDGNYSTALSSFGEYQGKNFELEATFRQLLGNERFVFNVREAPNSDEITKIVFDLADSQITVDRSQSSIQNLGENFPDTGQFRLISGEELKVRISVDNSIIEVYANDRFASTSRVYPSSESSVGTSYDFGAFDEKNVEFKFWQGLKNAWPGRDANINVSDLVSGADDKGLISN